MRIGRLDMTTAKLIDKLAMRIAKWIDRCLQSAIVQARHLLSEKEFDLHTPIARGMIETRLVSERAIATGIALDTASATRLRRLRLSGRWRALGLMSGRLTALHLGNIDMLTASTRETSCDRLAKLDLAVENIPRELPLPVSLAAFDLEKRTKQCATVTMANATPFARACATMRVLRRGLLGRETMIALASATAGSATRRVCRTGLAARVMMPVMLMATAGRVMTSVVRSGRVARGTTRPLTHAPQRGRSRRATGIETRAAMRLLGTGSAASCGRRSRWTAMAGLWMKDEAMIELRVH